jgi:hypothetical protein
MVDLAAIYEVLVNADLVYNTDTIKLAQDYTSSFFFQPGDADHNRVVNGDDFAGL